MEKHVCFTFFSRLMPAAILIIMACSTAGHSPDRMQKTSTKDLKMPVRSDMANPAAKKCLADGYVLEPVIENGVSVGNLCVNPITGSACDVWEYFRDACELGQK